MSQKRFIITGLPRSRTAWLANFFTYHKSFCYHEALKFCTRPQDVIEMMQGHPYVGNADSGWALFADQIPMDYKLIIVWRDPGEVRRSLTQHYPGGEGVIEKTSHCLARLASERWNDHQAVDYHSLEMPSTMMRLWDYVFERTVPFPLTRFNMLRHINMQVDRKAEMQMVKYLAPMMRGKLEEQ